jgi:hypothetical protein
VESAERKRRMIRLYFRESSDEDRAVWIQWLKAL